MQDINPQMPNRFKTDEYPYNICLTSAELFNPQMINRFETDYPYNICLTSAELFNPQMINRFETDYPYNICLTSADDRLQQLRCCAACGTSQNQFNDLDDIQRNLLPIHFHTRCF